MAQAARDCNTLEARTAASISGLQRRGFDTNFPPGPKPAAIAQMVRALDCGSRGPPFDPGWRYQQYQTDEDQTPRRRVSRRSGSDLAGRRSLKMDECGHLPRARECRALLYLVATPLKIVSTTCRFARSNAASSSGRPFSSEAISCAALA